MRITFAYGFILAVLAWMPHGLIHQGQRRINPHAESIVGQLLTRERLVTGCDPTTAEWRGCK
jgi:hypothetical protein